MIETILIELLSALVGALVAKLATPDKETEKSRFVKEIQMFISVLDELYKSGIEISEQIALMREFESVLAGEQRSVLSDLLTRRTSTLQTLGWGLWQNRDIIKVINSTISFKQLENAVTGQLIMIHFAVVMDGFPFINLDDKIYALNITRQRNNFIRDYRSKLDVYFQTSEALKDLLRTSYQPHELL